MAGISCMLRFVIFAAVIISATSTDYCKIKCKQTKTPHTMCLYKSPKPAAACRNWKDQGLSSKEKQALLKKHNDLRRKVASGKETRGARGQPAAISMPDLVWDDELELIAQRWTNQCDPDHDHCRNVERFSVGQNMAMMESSDDDITLESLFELWYEEVDLYDGNVSKYKHNSDTGHYTQLVWAETTKVGCGRIKYLDDDDLIAHYMICNYGPSGNVKDAPVYKTK